MIVDLKSGERIWYKRTGSSTGSTAPLLHIHGSAFGHRNFEKLTPLCAQNYEVIDIDLPGYGESTGAPAASMEGIADQVSGFLEAAKIGPVNLHGTSFGAMIGLTLTARRPDLVDKLVLSCFLARYDRAARMMRATWKRAAKESGMEAVADLTSVAGFARSFYERPEAEAQLQSMRDAFLKTTPEAFIKGTETIERTDLSGYAPQVKTQTLLLAGAEDNMTPFKPAESGVGFHQITQIMPNARLEVLPACGHYLVIEQPELAAKHIHEFLG